VLPRAMFDAACAVTLDDMTPQAIAQQLGAPLLIGENISDLLDAERLESGGMTFSFGPVDLLDVAEDAVSAIEPVALDAGVVIEIRDDDEGKMVRGDPDRLVQVLVNLLANAIRYSPSGSAIRVEMTVEGPVAVVAVIDAGPGVAAEVRSSLFERFAREEHASTGAGLGLYISRGIVTAHGGEISFESGPDGGTAFRFSVPLWRPAVALAAVEPEGRPTGPILG